MKGQFGTRRGGEPDNGSHKRVERIGGLRVRRRGTASAKGCRDGDDELDLRCERAVSDGDRDGDGSGAGAVYDLLSVCGSPWVDAGDLG